MTHCTRNVPWSAFFQKKLKTTLHRPHGWDEIILKTFTTNRRLFWNKTNIYVSSHSRSYRIVNGRGHLRAGSGNRIKRRTPLLFLSGRLLLLLLKLPKMHPASFVPKKNEHSPGRENCRHLPFWSECARGRSAAQLAQPQCAPIIEPERGANQFYRAIL